MAHTHSVKDDDNYFVINKDTMIISTESTSKTLMQHDHNSECYTFEIPRYVEGHDMMECTNIEIHYIGINSNTRETNTGIYECNDLSIIKNEDGTDSDKLSFSWLISGEVTKFPGPLSFCIRFACITDSVIDYQKFTNPYNGINITSSIYNTEIVYEEYADILQQWKNQMQDEFGTLKTNLKSELENYIDSQLGVIENGAY